MLVSMKRSAAVAAEEASDPMPAEMPWGMRFRLEDPELEKLGLLQNLPNVGDEIHLMAVCEVNSVSQTKMASGDAETCVCLQITQAAVEQQEKPQNRAEPQVAPRASNIGNRSVRVNAPSLVMRYNTGAASES